MKALAKFPVAVILSSLFLFFSCSNNNTEVQESLDSKVTIEYQIEFTAEYEGPDGTISITSEEGPLTILVGDKVTFVNTSMVITINSENGIEISRQEEPYIGEVLWSFATGIIENAESPNDTEQTSASFKQDQAVTVRYDKLDNSGGPYLGLEGTVNQSSGIADKFFLEFVEVSQ